MTERAFGFDRIAKSYKKRGRTRFLWCGERWRGGGDGKLSMPTCFPPNSLHFTKPALANNSRSFSNVKFFAEFSRQPTCYWSLDLGK